MTTADTLNTLSEARAAGLIGSQPMLCAQVLASTQRKLQDAVDAQQQAQATLQAAQSALRALGSDAEVQRAYERSLALGEVAQPPASREVQAARVRGLQQIADEAQARVAHLSSQVQAHRRAVVASLMPAALQRYRDAADQLAQAYADILTLQNQGAAQVLMNGNPLRIPSATGLPEPGGSGVLVSTSSVVDSGALGAADERIQAEIARLLSLLKQTEAEAA